ncbi:MAG: hypothetical protein IJS71_08315 [Clostridia bacterium]|nr:hypothetical protein [Clostridia bacterium]
MRIKNVSNKIIGFGTLAVLPNEIATVPKDFEDNDILDTYVEMDFIVKLLDTTADPEEVKKAQEGVADLSKKKKDELLEICAKLNLPGNQENTKKELCDMIIAATTAQN